MKKYVSCFCALKSIMWCNHINEEEQILPDNCHDICCHLPVVVWCQVNLVYSVHLWCSVMSGWDAGVDHYYSTISRAIQLIGLIFMLKRLSDSGPASFWKRNHLATQFAEWFESLFVLTKIWLGSQQVWKLTVIRWHNKSPFCLVWFGNGLATVHWHLMLEHSISNTLQHFPELYGMTWDM